MRPVWWRCHYSWPKIVIVELGQVGEQTGPSLMLAEATAHRQIIATRPDDEQPDLTHQRITALASVNPRLAFDHPDLIEAATYPETIRNAADALTRSH